jgi:hypothetical protein
MMVQSNMHQPNVDVTLAGTGASPSPFSRGTSSVRIHLSMPPKWPWNALAVSTILAAALTLAGRAVMPWQVVLPDYIHHWAAGALIASGQSPYDQDLQIAIHRDKGWDRRTDGRGILSFLPYYYPPWFALGCTLLLPLGYDGGKVAWFFLNLELLFLSGFFLRDAVSGLPRSIPVVAVPLFLFSLFALFVGQTPILVLFFAVVAWRLLAGGYDRAAGVALACMTIKPQLVAILILAVGIWAGRSRRWGVAWGFGLALGAFCLASTLLVPAWPIEMASATRRTPPPTEAFPWLGNTWFLILRTAGLRSWGLWALYLSVAVPVLWAVLKSAIERGRSLHDLMALGLLAVFFVSPYARHYDFVVLLVPSFVLIGDRLSERAGALLLSSLILVPYLQFILLVRYSRLVVPGVNFFLECTYFWIPLLLGALWMVTRSRSGAARFAAEDAGVLEHPLPRPAHGGSWS